MTFKKFMRLREAREAHGKSQPKVPRVKPRRRSKKQKEHARLQHQISKENKWLRSLRTYLPGREPDRFYT